MKSIYHYFVSHKAYANSTGAKSSVKERVQEVKDIFWLYMISSLKEGKMINIDYN